MNINSHKQQTLLTEEQGGEETSQRLLQAKVNFTTPLLDNADLKLDISRYLIKRPASTFFMKVKDNDLRNSGIFSGDIVIVDRSITPSNKSIVVINLNGELLIKKILTSRNTTYITPVNTRSTLLKITNDIDFEIWGVVIYNIHRP